MVCRRQSLLRRKVRKWASLCGIMMGFPGFRAMTPSEGDFLKLSFVLCAPVLFTFVLT